VIFGDLSAGDGESGAAELPGDNFVVTLGLWRRLGEAVTRYIEGFEVRMGLKKLAHRYSIVVTLGAARQTSTVRPSQPLIFCAGAARNSDYAERDCESGLTPLSATRSGRKSFPRPRTGESLTADGGKFSLVGKRQTRPQQQSSGSLGRPTPHDLRQLAPLEARDIKSSCTRGSSA
jgi:hypothetical protein